MFRTELTIAILLPLLSMYLLLIIRILEKRSKGDDTRFISPLRDAVLVALVLDIAGLSDLVHTAARRYVDLQALAIPLVVTAVLLLTHLMFFVMQTTAKGDREDRGNRLTESYLAFFMLLTNASTVVLLIDMLGRSQ